jgi:hypothetical protein
MKRALVIAFVALASCDRGAATNASPSASTDPNVHVLTLPDDDPPLPDAPGKSITVGSCLTCHSSRYIADQPTFPRKTWVAEVEKMKKTFGAPIDDESVKPIVDYLVATHGREE